MKKKKDFEDDGRQIADMSNVFDNWYGLKSRPKKPKKKASPDDENSEIEKEPELTKKEVRQLMANAMLAALAVGLVFVAVTYLFFMFAIHVWFK